MKDDLRSHKRLLRDLLRFLRDVERCSVCAGPEIAFEGRHAAEWAELQARIVQLSRDPLAEKAPN